MGRLKNIILDILKDKKYLKETLLVLLGGIIINALCFLLPLIVHAEGTYYPVESGVNAPLGAFTVEQILDYCNNYSSLPGGDDYYYIIKINDVGNNYYPSATSADVCVFSKSIFLNDNMNTFPLYCEVTNNGQFQFVLNNLYTNDRLNIKFYHLRSYSGAPTVSSVGVQNMDGNSPLKDAKTTYIFNVSVPKDYFTNTEFVLQFNESINVGDFVDLPNIDEILDDLNNSYQTPSSATGHALPSQPSENPNNTPFQDRLQMFDYLKDTLTALFGNLGFNISNWLNSLGSKIVQGFNSVSQNVWNGFSTLMSNIQGFFAPKLDYIIEKFNYITQEPDYQQIIDYIETTSVYSDISSINTSVSTFGSSFTGVAEPDDYTLTFHIEDIDILNQSNPFVLHLNILNPVKSTIRAFLWVIVSYGLFISVVDSLPNYINGGGGEDD